MNDRQKAEFHKNVERILQTPTVCRAYVEITQYILSLMRKGGTTEQVNFARAVFSLLDLAGRGKI